MQAQQLPQCLLILSITSKNSFSPLMHRVLRGGGGLTKTTKKRKQGGNAAAGMASAQPPPPSARNVLGGPLACCCTAPMTGFYRDGFCRTGGGDYGVHVVCARVTEEFLAFTKARGNDLSTPLPPAFPGLKPGDKWCLCASRWEEARRAGAAPPVVLAATHARALDFVSLADLKAAAVDLEAAQAEADAARRGDEGTCDSGGNAPAS